MPLRSAKKRPMAPSSTRSSMSVPPVSRLRPVTGRSLMLPASAMSRLLAAVSRCLAPRLKTRLATRPIRRLISATPRTTPIPVISPSTRVRTLLSATILPRPPLLSLRFSPALPLMNRRPALSILASRSFLPRRLILLRPQLASTPTTTMSLLTLKALRRLQASTRRSAFMTMKTPRPMRPLRLRA